MISNAMCAFGVTSPSVAGQDNHIHDDQDMRKSRASSLDRKCAEIVTAQLIDGKSDVFRRTTIIDVEESAIRKTHPVPHLCQWLGR